MSLAQGAYFNTVQILSGGSGSLFGSGNIGGSIHLNNEPVFNDGLTISAGLIAGSFDDYGLSARLAASGKKFYSSTSLLYKSSINDFPYENLEGDNVKQQNAAYRHYGLMQDLYWHFNTQWLAGISIWVQSNSREIPSTMVSKPSEASQDDQSIKSIVSLKNFHRIGYSAVKLAYFHDYLHYLDPVSLIEGDQDSKVSTDKIIAEIQDNRQVFSNTSLNTGASFSYEAGKSNNYEGFVDQNQLGFFVSLFF